MIGVLIVTHFDFGENLLQTAETIVGKQEGCLAISVDNSKEIESMLADIQSGVERVDYGDGVVILTDMFGGTPTNMSLSLLGSGKLEVITGANLPMLLKILNTREQPLESLAQEAKSAGRQGILVAGEVLRRKIANG
jgi:PTS system mannose-specific IIA component